MESFEPILVNRSISLEFGNGMKLTQSETFLSSWEQNPLMGKFSNSGMMSSGLSEFLPLIDKFKGSDFAFAQTPFSNFNQQLNPIDEFRSKNPESDPLIGNFSEIPEIVP